MSSGEAVEGSLVKLARELRSISSRSAVSDVVRFVRELLAVVQRSFDGGNVDNARQFLLLAYETLDELCCRFALDQSDPR